MILYQITEKASGKIHEICLSGCSSLGEVYKKDECLYKIVELDKRDRVGVSILYKPTL